MNVKILQQVPNLFTITEIENANKPLKHQKQWIYKNAPGEIVALLNTIAETGEYSKEIKLGQLTPPQLTPPQKDQQKISDQLFYYQHSEQSLSCV